jgi:hypothetical protein
MLNPEEYQMTKLDPDLIETGSKSRDEKVLKFEN